jgi:hypothetical protein
MGHALAVRSYGSRANPERSNKTEPRAFARAMIPGSMKFSFRVR